MTKTAVIFARGRNIQGQVEKCTAYAESKGYEVAGVIVGQGRELPEVIKGLGIEIDVVLVSCMSRISRNALESYTIQADLELCCGTLVEVASNEPRSEAFDNLMRNVMIAVKENETKERVRHSLIMRGLLDE